MRENDVRGRKPAPRCAPETETGKSVTVKLAFSVPFAVCILVQKRE